MPSLSARGPARYIGEVARAAGVSIHTVRYYERLGLLPPAQRTPGGYRVYSLQTIERLRFIHQAQAVGLRLSEVREILRVRYLGQSPCDCVRTLLERKLSDVERQMEDLHRFRRRLQQTLKRSRQLPRLPHQASELCPLIEGAAMKARAPGWRPLRTSKSRRMRNAR